jgi:RecA/RadA recombinase
MAKSIKKAEEKSNNEARRILDSISKTLPVQEKKVDDPIEYISTGIYILNAALSGSIYGGIRCGKVTVFAGEESTGKTFLALNACREAQQKYNKQIIYIDTESNISLDDLHKYGIDRERFSLFTINKVEELTIQLNMIIEGIKASNGKNLYMIVIDSIGQMASKKEKDDLADGNIKTDMTKSKALSTLFRTITSDFGALNIPVVCCNQTYQTLDMYPKVVMKGGGQLYYSASVIAFLSKAKLKEDDLDDISEELSIGQTGIIVSAKCVKNRNVQPRKVKFELSHNKGANKFVGLDVFCVPELFARIGIAKGKMDIDKTTGEMNFVAGGNRWYVNHLNTHVAYKDLFNELVFNKTVLDAIDLIAQKNFKYKTNDESNDEWTKLVKELKEKKGGVIDNLDLDDDDVVQSLFEEE